MESLGFYVAVTFEVLSGAIVVGSGVAGILSHYKKNKKNIDNDK